MFGGPFCGGAPVALSVIGRDLGIPVTLFYAKRKKLHRRQAQAQANGARIVEVSPGYMTVVQKRARDYAAENGARFLPLGFDSPEAEDPFVEEIGRIRSVAGNPEEVWCASGSGMLARCLGKRFPMSKICAVAVGLKSRWAAQAMPSNVQVFQYPKDFAWEKKECGAPFSICGNYEAKAWDLYSKIGKPSALFWNVLGY